MKAKPRGQKYRNLVARGGVVYYERVVAGRRNRFSTETDDWDVAASVRDLYETRRGVGKLPHLVREVPTLAEFAPRYLEEDTAHLADTTRRQRVRALQPASKSGLLEGFGAKRLDEVTKRDVREWWGRWIESRGRSTKTGRNSLDDLSGMFAYARALELIPDDHDPVGAFRETLKAKQRTKRGRAEAVRGREVRPIERPEEVDAFVEAAREIGDELYVFVLCLLDAGLRLGEARALRFSRVAWGTGEDDPADTS